MIGPFVHVGQGDCLATADPAITYSTVLGSCVTICLHDPAARVGGINHSLLPCARGAAPPSAIVPQAFVTLLDLTLRAGASAGRLTARMFGGARIVADLPDIGAANIAAAHRALAAAGVPCIAEHVGGVLPRRLHFHPVSGAAWLIARGPR